VLILSGYFLLRDCLRVVFSPRNKGGETMLRTVYCRKSPCRICRRWFMPNPRLKDRQKTCADPQCKREWHRKKCAQWNKKNADYFKSNYLQKRFDAPILSEESSKPLPPKSRFNSGLPLEYVQEVIGIEHLIIIEYFGQLLFRRFQEVLREELIVNTGKVRQLPPVVFSRCDRH